MIIRVIIRPLLRLIITLTFGIITYISAHLGERIVRYTQYVIVTGRYPGRSRNPVGFVDNS